MDVCNVLKEASRDEAQLMYEVMSYVECIKNPIEWIGKAYAFWYNEATRLLSKLCNNKCDVPIKKCDQGFKK